MMTLPASLAHATSSLSAAEREKLGIAYPEPEEFVLFTDLNPMPMADRQGWIET